MSEKSKVKKSKKRDLDKESEQSSAPLTQTRDIESLIEEEDHELNSSGSKPTKKSKTNITVVNNIIRLNELNYACVQAYKEQYHKFQGMNHQFDYMGNIDRIIKKQIETTLITGGMDENDALKWENLPFDDVFQGLLRGLSTKEANSYADELRKVKFHQQNFMSG